MAPRAPLPRPGARSLRRPQTGTGAAARARTAAARKQQRRRPGSFLGWAAQGLPAEQLGRGAGGARGGERSWEAPTEPRPSRPVPPGSQRLTRALTAPRGCPRRLLAGNPWPRAGEGSATSLSGLAGVNPLALTGGSRSLQEGLFLLQRSSSRLPPSKRAGSTRNKNRTPCWAGGSVGGSKALSRAASFTHLIGVIPQLKFWMQIHPHPHPQLHKGQAKCPPVFLFGEEVPKGQPGEGRQEDNPHHHHHRRVRP